MNSLVAFVTGSASGLGLAVAKRLATRGMRVIGFDMFQKSGEEDSREDSLLIPVKGDIREEVDIRRGLEKCIDSKGNQRLDILVNCAGVANAFKIYNFENKIPQRLEDFRDLISINVCGTFNVIRLAAELMAKSSSGLIVNTSSSFAGEGHEGQSGLCATQMAINSMTLPLARDLSTQGIRVVTIAPGFFGTPLVLRCDSPELLEFIKLTTPCPSRLGEPEEFALLVDQLVDNQMINGCVIRLDGANRWPERG